WIESLSPVNARGKWNEAAITISLRCINDTRLAELKHDAGSGMQAINNLRFYINGDAHLVYPLYEMIFNHSTKVELRPAPQKRESGTLRATSGLGKTPPVVWLPATNIKPVGFAAEEAMLPYPPRSFAGYRLLTEYFTFPDKFLFFDIT